MKRPETKSETLQEIKKEQLLAKSEVSLWLDTYDDIFSDFDPRPYSQRALSDDFLFEAKKATRERKEGTLTLHLLMPTALRNAAQEAIIKKRLREHFKKHADLKVAEQEAIAKKGVLFVIAGAIILIIATLVSYYGNEGIVKDFLIVLLEPAGWFTVWNGLDLIFFRPGDVKPDVDFYVKMTKAEFVFDNI